MFVLAVNGSPRPAGNTNALVEAVLGGARQGGARTEKLQLGQLAIAGCRACQQCKRSHRCVIDDGMQRFYDLAPAADVLLLASPIYLDHITAQLMAFIQRMYCYIGPGMENYYPRPGVRAAVGITFGLGRRAAYDYVLDWLADRLDGYWQIPTLDKFRIAGTVYDPPAGDRHPEIKRAVAFGRSLAAGG